MTVPENLHYTAEHEWVSIDGEVASVGITDYAQQALGDVVFVELPAVGAALAKGDSAAVVESVKAASDVFAPVSGEVVEVNKDVDAEPGLINQDAMGRGWIFKIKLADPNELASLLSEADYAAFLKTLA